METAVKSHVHVMVSFCLPCSGPQVGGAEEDHRLDDGGQGRLRAVPRRRQVHLHRGKGLREGFSEWPEQTSNTYGILNT